MKGVLPMRIAVTATGADMDVEVDPRFGRCAYFVIVETDDMSFKALPNPNVAAGSGAGIGAGQLMAKEGVRAVLTGNVGPNAYRTLNAAGIEVIAAASGTVRQAVEQFLSGKMSASSNATVPGHFGMGGTEGAEKRAFVEDQPAISGRGSGMGGGGGRGGGHGQRLGRRGGGMGRGRGGGTGMGARGNCVCPNCGKTVPHQPGVPCSQVKCPACGARMMRQ